MSPRSRNLTEQEYGGLLWLIVHYLPNMIGSGGRVLLGYPTQERKLRWERVRYQMLRIFGVDRTLRQYKHRWADVINREQDLLDHLGIEVEGTIGKSNYIYFMY